MASNSSKTPPSLSNCKTYENLLQLIQIWWYFTKLPAKRQGSALVLSLEDEALDAVLEIDEVEIAGENGVDSITNRVNRLFKRGSTITKYQAFESFMTFKRLSPMSIPCPFLNEFDEHLFKTKVYGTAMSEELIKATIPDL